MKSEQRKTYQSQEWTLSNGKKNPLKASQKSVTKKAKNRD